MKATRTLTLFMGIIATFVFICCKKTDLVDGGEDVTGKPKIVIVTDPAPISIADCSSTCINPEGPYIESSASKTQTWGNTSDPRWKTVNHVAYNTATSFVVKVTFTHSGGNASNVV